MQYQTCECGERIHANELKQKLLAHWPHQRSCLYSYIGCVSIYDLKIFEATIKEIMCRIKAYFCVIRSRRNHHVYEMLFFDITVLHFSFTGHKTALNI